MIYQIERHHRGLDWYTETYAIFDDKEKMLLFIKEQIGNDSYSDWLLEFFYVYKINDPLLKDREEIDYKSELFKRFPEVEDLVKHREREHHDSLEYQAYGLATFLQAGALMTLLEKSKKKN